MNTAIKIDHHGEPTPEVVAQGLTADRAYTLALGVRRTLKLGERLYTETATGFVVIASR